MDNAVSLVSLLAGNVACQAASLESGIAVLEKTNDIAAQQGNALVELLMDSMPQQSERLLDVYA